MKKVLSLTILIIIGFTLVSCPGRLENEYFDNKKSNTYEELEALIDSYVSVFKEYDEENYDFDGPSWDYYHGFSEPVLRSELTDKADASDLRIFDTDLFESLDNLVNTLKLDLTTVDENLSIKEGERIQFTNSIPTEIEYLYYMDGDSMYVDLKKTERFGLIVHITVELTDLVSPTGSILYKTYREGEMLTLIDARIDDWNCDIINYDKDEYIKYQSFIKDIGYEEVSYIGDTTESSLTMVKYSMEKDDIYQCIECTNNYNYYKYIDNDLYYAIDNEVVRLNIRQMDGWDKIVPVDIENDIYALYNDNQSIGPNLELSIIREHKVYVDKPIVGILTENLFSLTDYGLDTGIDFNLVSQALDFTYEDLYDYFDPFMDYSEAEQEILRIYTQE